MGSSFHIARLSLALCACLPHFHAFAQQRDTTHTHQAQAVSTHAVFIASTAKPFEALMHDAMAVMNDGMTRAPMNGDPEHDFVSMMLPHHQGAIDMARAVLLHTHDAGLRNLALGIIAEQQNEVNVMQAWLKSHPQSKGQKR